MATDSNVVHVGGCPNCPRPEIWLWSPDTPAHVVHKSPIALNLDMVSDSVAVIFVNAIDIRTCKTCLLDYSNLLSIPDFWWSRCCHKSNGYFGSLEVPGSNVRLDELDERPSEVVIWMRVKLKKVKSYQDYSWVNVNVVTRSLSTGSHLVVIFDATPTKKERLRTSLLGGLQAHELNDAFWAFPRLLGVVASLTDKAVWRVTEAVRNVEKSSSSSSARPEYRALHDLARHAIHVYETVAVTRDTMGRMVDAHERYTQILPRYHKPVQELFNRRVRDSLLFYENVARALSHRAGATRDRLQNEIQLSFNTVAERDAATTIQIGRIAAMDSAVMKAIAILTLAFLPATFVSAVFSTTFFSFDAGGGDWGVSDKFWVFWVIVVPVTLSLYLLWNRWGLFASTAPVAAKKTDQEGQGGLRRWVATDDKAES